MADTPYSKEKAMANRSKDRRKSQAPKSKSKAKVEKLIIEKNLNDEDSEESNMDDRQQENEEDEEEEDSDNIEWSGQEEVLGEGMYEVEAIRKKRIRKVHKYSSTSEYQFSLTVRPADMTEPFFGRHSSF